jgi:hypothetical protein
MQTTQTTEASPEPDDWVDRALLAEAEVRRLRGIIGALEPADVFPIAEWNIRPPAGWPELLDEIRTLHGQGVAPRALKPEAEARGALIGLAALILAAIVFAIVADLKEPQPLPRDCETVWGPPR